MFYTVGEAAKILKIAPSALRYYDKEGLLPFVERSNGGIRRFREEDFGWLFIIECLKKSGLSIKDIKAYIDMSLKGDETIDDRLQMFRNQREKVRAQMAEMQKTLDALEYKCWYYETAKKAGTTAVMKDIPDDKVPENLREAKENLNRLQKLKEEGR